MKIAATRMAMKEEAKLMRNNIEAIKIAFLYSELI